MEDLNSSIKTGEQPGAGPVAEATPADSVLESPGARRPAEEPTAIADGLGGGERLAPMADEQVAVPRATARAAGSSEVDAGVVDAAP